MLQQPRSQEETPCTRNKNVAATKITRRNTMHKKQECCSNQDHKKKHHAQEHKIHPGKLFSNKGEKPSQILCYILQEKDLSPPRMT
jgi:hypothetical protein